MKRRDFVIAGTALLAQAARAQEVQPIRIAPPSATPLQVGMLLYPGLTLLDLIGPQTVLSPFSSIHLLWTSLDPITTDSGIRLFPNTTLQDCPADLDVVFVPGGNHMTALNGKGVLPFLADRGARAKYVTSVCSGSIVLGAAGLLRGYKATSHWAAKELLPLFGAEPTDGRVVVDRNRVTGGGVTAGIDFGLVMLAKLRGEETAKLSQLAMEYDPQPPFEAGSPQKAGPALTGMLGKRLEAINLATRQFAAEKRGL